MPESAKTDETIFAAAIELPPDQRAAYLDNICGNDAALRERVDGLLRSHEHAGSFLHKQPLDLGATADCPPLTEVAGTVIGRYKLLQVIGEGGFGVVYMAEQKEPVRRKVALKIIKLGMDSKEVIARFEAERQALALMDHPNIAKVLDAGTTETGRPYFVMELVKGVPIGEFCDKNQFPARQRLEIFTAVCQAVQHAHQKGIIHRDIKPSNVLVTLHDGKPVPKVIDFGVAKALNQELTEKTLFTAFGHMIGTPQYMSPEQAEMSGLDVDTRSDVYSLGVLLYELLTGTTPLEGKKLRSAGYAEMQRMIREEEPPQPSVRVSTLGESLSVIAKDRHCDPDNLQKLLRGELDWIVMKSLEKDRTRRYETASAFAADVRRHLSDEVVEARPPSAWYRLQKFARRRKGWVATTIALALLLVTITIGSLWAAAFFHRQEEQQRVLAIKEEKARNDAENSRKSEAALRALSDQRGQELYRNLYASEMSLAGQAEASLGGLSHASELVAKWRNSKPDLRGWEWYYLDRLCRTDLRTLSGHSSSVTKVAWSPDGSRLASASFDKTARIWKAVSGKLEVILKGHTSEVYAVTWSPDGKRLATASADKTIKIWDTSNGNILLTLSKHAVEVEAVAWCPDGKRLAGGYRDSVIIIWDTESGEEILTYSGHKGEFYELAWSPDGNRIASITRFSAHVWDPLTGKDLLLERPGGETVRGIAWSPNGDRLATGSENGAIFIWDPENGKVYLKLIGHEGGASSLSWEPDGKRLVSGSRFDSTVRVWDTTVGKQLSVFRGHGGPVLSVAWDPVGSHLASASSDGTVKIWDVVENTQTVVLRGLRGAINTLAWSPDGTRIAASGGGKVIKIWNPDTAQEIQSFPEQPGAVRSLDWSPDSASIATACDNTVSVWETATGKKLRTLDHESYLYEVVWNPNGTQLASGAFNTTVKTWDFLTGKEIVSLRGHTFGVLGVVWKPDGSQIATCSWDNTIKVWNAATGKEIHTLRGHSSVVVRISWSPDGKRLASASDDGTIKIWNPSSGENLMTLRGHTSVVSHVAWSPDGMRLASASRDKTVKIWDTEDGRELLTIRKHNSIVVVVAWSPDGKRLASAGYSGIVLIHDARPAAAKP